MREATIQELVKDLQGKTVKVESVDIYGVEVNFFNARIEYNEEDNELSFVSGRHDSKWGFGGITYRVDDVVESITLNDDGSYQIEFNQYMADILIELKRQSKAVTTEYGQYKEPCEGKTLQGFLLCPYLSGINKGIGWNWYKMDVWE